MTCTEEYKEHIEYTFHAFCKVVIRNAKYNALRTWRRKYQREISLEYLLYAKWSEPYAVLYGDRGEYDTTTRVYVYEPKDNGQ